jgi:2-polyprenyl-6-hydroxyphenyl methylase/3-demethylubiquinone-9 3-methyltransferase
MMTSTTHVHYYDTYDPGKPYTHSYLWPRVFQELATLPVGSQILDAGCGNGTFAKELVVRHFNVCGVDLEESGVAIARALCPECRFEVFSLYDDVGACFGHHFDAVVSLEVVEHLYDPRAFVARVFECLRPGGTFIVSTPYHGYLKNLLIAAVGKFDRHVSPLWDGGHIKFWSRKTLTALLKEKGFHVTGFHGAGRLPLLWKSMLLFARRP